MQHLPSPLHDGLEFASLSFLPANTMSREKSRAEIEKFRGRSALFSSSGLLFDTVGFSSEVAANKRANGVNHRLFPRQTAHNSLHCPTVFPTRVLALASRNPGIRTTPHGITSSTADLAFRFLSSKTKRKKEHQVYKKARKLQRLLCETPPVTAVGFAPLPSLLPFSFFPLSTFLSSPPLPCVLQPFFPLALRGTFFSNHSLDRESHAWIRWHNTHSRFSFPFLPWQKCTVLPHPVPLKHVALRLTTTWCAVEPDFWIHQCSSVPFIPFQAFEKRPGEAKTHHQKSRLEQCKSSALYQKHRLHPLLARCKRPTSHVTGYWRARHHNRMSCPPCHVLFTTSAQCRTFPTTGLPFVPFFLLSTRLECQGDQGTYGGV